MAKDKAWKLGALLSLLMLSGCATKHAYMSKPQSLGPEQWQCEVFDYNNCSEVRMWQPSQLTSAGCLAHTIVTGGHIAWECRKPKEGNLPKGGRWIWHGQG